MDESGPVLPVSTVLRSVLLIVSKIIDVVLGARIREHRRSSGANIVKGTAFVMNYEMEKGELVNC